MDLLIDPIEALRPLFREALAAAFGDEFRDEDPVLRPSTHAHLQANLAMGLARKVKQAPRAVAEALAAKLPRGEVLAQVEIAGPGFLNLTLADAWIEGAVNALASDARLGVARPTTPERVVIDASSPSVVRGLEASHLRGAILGDALARTLSWVGHEIFWQSHLGDWDMPLGMLIEHLLDVGGEQNVGEVSAFAWDARRKFDRDPAFAERSRARWLALQAYDEETLGCWKNLVGAAQRQFSSFYQDLGVSLTEADIRGESFYQPLLALLCDELEREGKAVVSDGALCVFLPGFVTREKTAIPLILRKKDGRFGQAAVELAALRYRLTELGATRVLYVMESSLEQHLSMVFEAARRFGWMHPSARAKHVTFGSVRGPSPLKIVRPSTSLNERFEAVVTQVRESLQRYGPERDAATLNELSRELVAGAWRWTELSHDRGKNVAFDLERTVTYESDSAAYLQFTHVCLQGIFRKAGEAFRGAPNVLSQEAYERSLALALLGFARVVREVERTLKPHLLCTYLRALADTLRDAMDVVDHRAAPSRLALLALGDRVLCTGLGLLGITTPLRM